VATPGPSHAVRRTTLARGDPDPKALACSGVLWQEGTPDDPKRDQMWLRFVKDRPVSGITTQFLPVVLHAFAHDGPDLLASHLGSCILAYQQNGSHVDQAIQSERETDGPRGSDLALFAAQTKPLAQPD
jgi:hypothetical protein